VKAGRLDGSTEGHDGIVGKDAGREVRLDGSARRFAVLVGIVDGRQDTVDRRDFPPALLVFPAAALTFRSTVLVLRSTSLALPSRVTQSKPTDLPTKRRFRRSQHDSPRESTLFSLFGRALSLFGRGSPSFRRFPPQYEPTDSLA
jgi:hypothetical protein